jgi:GH18 family chitinase
MRRVLVFLCSLILVLASSGAVSAAPPHSGPPGQLDRSHPQVVGYFIQWGIYGRGFFVKNLVDNGSAEKLTVINYAFGNVAPNDEGKIVCRASTAGPTTVRRWPPRTASMAWPTSGARPSAATSTSSAS